jgi:hypothetical protein
VKKCTIYLYNIPEGVEVPSFSSIAWSYDARGPIKGLIATVVVRRDIDGNMVLYDVPDDILKDAPDYIQRLLAQRKYLGVPKNALLNNSAGKEKVINKLYQKIGLVSKKADSIQEARITHNMLVCQVANYSPICIDMSLEDCCEIDKRLIKAYQYKLKCMNNDAKHHIFISQRKGGLGVKSFTREYIGALLRDIEVEISNPDSMAAHALHASIEATIKKETWKLNCLSQLPSQSVAAENASNTHISGRKLQVFTTDLNEPVTCSIMYDHTHIMEKAIITLSKLGFMLRNLDYEFESRFTDELLLFDKQAKVLGCSKTVSRAKLGPVIGLGNSHLTKYSMAGRVSLLISVLFQESILEIS